MKRIAVAATAGMLLVATVPSLTAAQDGPIS